MRRKLGLLASIAVLALPAQSGVAAAQTVGQTFNPTACVAFVNFTALQASAGGNPYAVGVSGHLSSWSFQVGHTAVPGLKLRVARPQSDGSYLFVGGAAAGAQTPNAKNTYPINIPVEAGDIIGIYVGPGVPAPCFATTSSASDSVAFFTGDPAVGAAPTPSSSIGQRRIPVSATLVPDGTSPPASPPPASSTVSYPLPVSAPAGQNAAGAPRKCKRLRSKRARKRCQRRLAGGSSS